MSQGVDLLSTTIFANLISRRTVFVVKRCGGQRWRRTVHQTASTCPTCAFVAKGVEFVTYRAAIAGSRGKLIYSSVDRRTMHALFVDHPPPTLPDKRRQIKCGRTEMLLLQSIKFLLQPPQPRRTSIRPVGSAWLARSLRYRSSDRLSSAVQLFNIRQQRRLCCLYRLLFVIEAPEPDTGDLCSSRRRRPTERRDIFVQ